MLGAPGSSSGLWLPAGAQLPFSPSLCQSICLWYPAAHRQERLQTASFQFCITVGLLCTGVGDAEASCLIPALCAERPRAEAGDPAHELSWCLAPWLTFAFTLTPLKLLLSGSVRQPQSLLSLPLRVALTSHLLFHQSY